MAAIASRFARLIDLSAVQATIRCCCDVAIDNGTKWIKTATGWAPTGATVANLTIISDQVRGRVGLKAAGGVRTLDDVRAFYRLGVRLSSARALLGRLDAEPGSFPELAGA